uniref:Reticulon-like protein n=1 Tax=Trypanosoma congolense (strain IL3000) TaxID=1068625 RepID=G0UNW8_TRYCI|nr:putative reticulon domain protein [Trypanosoma congolense IL3000]
MSCFLCNQLKGLTPWEVLAWRRPTATGSLAALLLGTILFFWYMKYTAITLLCRILQLLFVVMPAMVYMKMGMFTSDDIHAFVERASDCITPYAVLVLEAGYGLVTWRDKRLSTGVAFASFVLSLLGSHFSDMAILAGIVGCLFVLPVVYEKNNVLIDKAWADLMETAEQQLMLIRTKVDQMTKKNN